MHINWLLQRPSQLSTGWNEVMQTGQTNIKILDVIYSDDTLLLNIPYQNSQSGSTWRSIRQIQLDELYKLTGPCMFKVTKNQNQHKTPTSQPNRKPGKLSH